MSKNSLMKKIDTILCEMGERENVIYRATDVVVSGDTIEGVRAMADLLLVHKHLLAHKELQLSKIRAELAVAQARVQAMESVKFFLITYFTPPSLSYTENRKFARRSPYGS